MSRLNQGFFLKRQKNKLYFSFIYLPMIAEIKVEKLVQSFENRHSFFRFLAPQTQTKYLFTSSYRANDLKDSKISYKVIVLSGFFNSIVNRKRKRVRYLLLKGKNKYLFSF